MEDKLYEKYAHLLLKSGSEELLPVEYAKQFILDATNLELAVVGIDSFFSNEDGLNPDSNFIVDLSNDSPGVNWIDYLHENNLEASKLVSSHVVGEGYYYHFTLLSHEEFLQQLN